MAVSENDEDTNLIEDVSRNDPADRQGETSDKCCDVDNNAHNEAVIHLNMEAFKGFDPLPDIDNIEVVLVQPAPTWARWSEGLVIHVVGAGIVAVLAFIAGLIFAETTSKADSVSSQPLGCMTAPVTAPEKKAD